MTRIKDGPEFANDYYSAKAPERIAAALERLAGTPLPCDFSTADAFVFVAGAATLVPVPRVNRVDIGLLRGIDQARETLLANTERFAQNFAANNALLWGARGMGKSALIKAVHATINAQLAAFPDSKPLRSPASGDHPTSGFRVWRSPWLRRPLVQENARPGRCRTNHPPVRPVQPRRTRRSCVRLRIWTNGMGDRRSCLRGRHVECVSGSVQGRRERRAVGDRRRRNPLLRRKSST
jgi:Protein of unknown function (DUF815)